MKVFVAVVISLSPLLCSAASIKNKRSVGAAFGPQNCVALTRSSVGSCVISTDCEGADLSKTEFAFDCVRQGGEIVRHSFGTGGFDTNEEFDTQVQCDRCDSATPVNVVSEPAATPPVKEEKVAPPPTPVAQATPKTKEEVPASVPAPVVFKAKRRVATESQATAKVTTKATAQASAQAGFWPFTSSEKKEEPAVVKYGPNGCVSTWRSEEGHCIIRTDCQKSDISKYEFGLVCVDKVGSPVRHLFGKDSFDSQETFDTLIKCDQCLGLEDIPDAIALNGEVVTLSKDISNLKAVMKNISINVQMLNEEVFKNQGGPAPAPAPAAAEPAKAEKKAAGLVHHSSELHRTGVIAQEDQQRQKHHLRHSHQKHRHYDDDDDDEREDDEAESGDDEDDTYDED